MKHLKLSSVLTWNKRGELSVDGRPIDGTHVIDLVTDVFKPKCDGLAVQGLSGLVKTELSSSDAGIFQQIIDDNCNSEYIWQTMKCPMSPV